MTEKYYLDASIWVDFYENRKGYNNECLGDYAFKLLIQIKAKADRIILTDFLIRELEVRYSIEEINGMFKLFEHLVDKIMITKEQKEEANKISEKRNVPKGDAIHAIIARDNKLILITRDNHFRSLEDISFYYRPEEFI